MLFFVFVFFNCMDNDPFIFSRLGYCNWLPSRCPNHLEKRQTGQNSAVLRAPERNCVSPLFRMVAGYIEDVLKIYPSKHFQSISYQLFVTPFTLIQSPWYNRTGWLGVKHQLRTYFSDTAPVYLSDFLHTCCPSRNIRSSSHPRTICIPHVKTKPFGHRSLSYAAPSVCNSVPRELTHIESTAAFRPALKTDLFKNLLPLLNFLWTPHPTTCF